MPLTVTPGTLTATSTPIEAFTPVGATTSVAEPCWVIVAVVVPLPRTRARLRPSMVRIARPAASVLRVMVRSPVSVWPSTVSWRPVPTTRTAAPASIDSVVGTPATVKVWETLPPVVFSSVARVPRDRDTGYVERHRARDGGGQPGAGQQDQGGALAQPQDAGEVERDVGGGHLDDRGGRRGRDLLEREVAGEHLAGHGEAQAGRLEAQVGAAGQAECRRGRGVDGQPERPGGGDPGGQHEGDLAGDPAGQTGRADDQRAGAVGQRDAVPVRHQLEADPAEDDGGRGRRPLHGDVGGDRLAEDGQGDGGAVETEVGPGGEVEAGGRRPDREALVHRGRAGVQRRARCRRRR